MSFDEVKDKLFQHHEKLKEISHQNFKGDIHGLEGNIYTYNGENHLPFMVNKMRHIYELAKECNGDILEIGFNAGNSSLIFLMANPTCKIYAFDICIHSYVKPCVDYLNRHFGNRVILKLKETAWKLCQNFPNDFLQISKYSTSTDCTLNKASKMTCKTANVLPGIILLS